MPVTAFLALCAALTVVSSVSAESTYTVPRGKSTYSDKSTDKIVGGTTTHIDDARFMVQIFWCNKTNPTNNPGDWVHYCGGTLISQYHVLTAGHCVKLSYSVRVQQERIYIGPAQRETASSSSSSDDFFTYKVVVGSSDFLARGKNGRTVDVLRYERHPKYRDVDNGGDQTSLYDVTVASLKEAVPASAKTAIIALTKANQRLRAGTTVTVSGWGVYTADMRTRYSRKLRTANFTVNADSECKSEFPKLFFEGQEFCAKQNPKLATCRGDSGSPAYAGNTQYGVASWGSCGDSGSGVFASLADPDINAFIVDKLKTL